MKGHGLVGPGKMIGAVTRKCHTAPQFKLDFFHYFFRVGLCPTRFLPCRTRGDMAGAGCSQDGGDRVDPSQRDHSSTHMLKIGVK